MGLDIYLKRCPDWTGELAKEKLDDELTDADWDEAGEYSSLSQEQRDTIRAKQRVRRAGAGLDEFGSSDLIETIEEDSVTDPQHLFKVGYLRSSYNSGGIQSVLHRIGLPGLDYIFGPSDEYHINPDWQACLERANEVIAKYDAWYHSEYSAFDVAEISNIDGVRSAEDALKVFLKERKEYDKQPKAFDAYSSREGTFYMSGMQVYGFIRNTGYGSGMFAVYKRTRTGTLNDDWYYKALLITRETIDYVLAKSPQEQGNYRLAWSS